MGLFLFLVCFLAASTIPGAVFALAKWWSTDEPNGKTSAGRAVQKQPDDDAAEALKRLMEVIDDWNRSVDPDCKKISKASRK
jgi:hypothetical protein